MIPRCRAEVGSRLSNVHFDFACLFEVVVWCRQGHSMWAWGWRQRTFTVVVFPDGNRNKWVGDGSEGQLPLRFGGAPSFIAPGSGFHLGDCEVLVFGVSELAQYIPRCGYSSAQMKYQFAYCFAGRCWLSTWANKMGSHSFLALVLKME